MNRVDTFLELTVNQAGSDLHLVSGHVPRIRIHGVVHAVRFRELSSQDLQTMLFEIISDQHRERLQNELAVDFAYTVEGLGRFRVNVYQQKGTVAFAMRSIMHAAASIRELNLPPVLEQIAMRPRGLVLVTGVTGSGKTSPTLARVYSG